MLKSSSCIENIITSLSICILLVSSSVTSIDNQCDNNLFILLSTKTVYLLDFNSPLSTNVIYRTSSNRTTIESGVFYKPKNTILLLLKGLNQTYSILSLYAYDTIYTSWREKSMDMQDFSYVSLSRGQRYLYLFNNQTMLLQLFTVPFKSTPSKQMYLSNLPQNPKVLQYIIDERFQFLWILLENIPYQLYKCQLKNSSCELYMNMFNLNKPIEMSIQWHTQQFYISSRNTLIIFEYRENQTDYSIHSLNSTQPNHQRFLTLCENTDHLEYLSIINTNNRQVCFSTSCHSVPFVADDTTPIHTIQRLSSVSSILYCSRQRRTSRIVVWILILCDLATVLGVIIWLGFKYFRQSSADEEKKQVNDEKIWSTDKDFVTHF